MSGYSKPQPPLNIEVTRTVDNGAEIVTAVNKVPGEIHESVAASANFRQQRYSLYEPGTLIPAKGSTTIAGEFADYGYAPSSANPAIKDANSKIFLKKGTDGSIFVSKTTMNPNTKQPDDLTETVYIRSATGNEFMYTIQYRVNAQGNPMVGFPDGVRHYDIYGMEAGGAPAYEYHIETLGNATLNGRYAPNGGALSAARKQELLRAGHALTNEAEAKFGLPLSFKEAGAMIDPAQFGQSVKRISEQFNVPTGATTPEEPSLTLPGKQRPAARGQQK